MNKYAVYERIKAEIARTAKTHGRQKRTKNMKSVLGRWRRSWGFDKSLLTKREKCGIINKKVESMTVLSISK